MKKKEGDKPKKKIVTLKLNEKIPILGRSFQWYEDFEGEFFEFVQSLPKEVNIKRFFLHSIDFLIAFGELKGELEK